MGSWSRVVVRAEERLARDFLVSVYGGEGHLAEAVASLHQVLQEKTVEPTSDLEAAREEGGRNRPDTRRRPTVGKRRSLAGP